MMVLGPVLGGYLTENVSWRGVFFSNVPLANVVLAITLSHMPESRDPGSRRLDLPGAALAAVGLGGIVFGLLESSRVGLGDPLVVGSLIIGVVALGAFLVVEGRGLEPMMPLSLFRSRNFAGANAFTLLFFLPLNLIQGHGYSATAAGAAIAPAILVLSLLSRYTGGLTDRYGARLLLVVGPAIGPGQRFQRRPPGRGQEAGGGRQRGRRRRGGRAPGPASGAWRRAPTGR